MLPIAAMSDFFSIVFIIFLILFYLLINKIILYIYWSIILETEDRHRDTQGVGKVQRGKNYSSFSMIYAKVSCMLSLFNDAV